MIEGRELQLAMLSILFRKGGQATLASIVSSLEGHPSLTLSDWKKCQTTGEPIWVRDIRRNFQILKEAGELDGYEHSDWNLTPLGFASISDANPWLQALRTRRHSSEVERSRDRSLHLKRTYDFRCQVCGELLDGGPEEYIVESHHLRPLGTPHLGPDTESNIVILCPNHHAQFDKGVIAIHPNSLLVNFYDRSRPSTALHAIRHTIAVEFLNYHWKQIFLRNVPYRKY